MDALTSRRASIVGAFQRAGRGADADRLLLDGAHLIEEALGAGLAIETAALASRLPPEHPAAALASRLERAGVRVLLAPGPVMEALSPVRTPSGLVALARRPAGRAEPTTGAALRLLLIDVQDPGNVGAVVRAAEAAGATSLWACGATADPFGWKALRGGMGSTFRLPVVRSDIKAAIADARARGLRLLAMTPRGGRPLPDAALAEPVAVLIGGEGRGLAPEVIAESDDTISIPMRPPVESLNLAVAAALVVYEAFRQRRNGTPTDSSAAQHA
jgi:RNA methyltransferase, TrmH family